MRRGLAALLGALACGCADRGAPVEAPAPDVVPVVRYVSPGPPKVADLPCFQCHDYTKWGEAPGQFPHEFDPHKEVGHCHMCHEITGHRHNAIVRATCLGCHEEPVPLLGPAAEAGK